MIDADATNESFAAHKMTVADRIKDVRAAQRHWQQSSIAGRLLVVRRFRQLLAARGGREVALLGFPASRDLESTLATELIPLADACRFLERNARGILRETRYRSSDRPAWLRGISVTLQREPKGVVLIIGAWNYPLLLSGIQALQALVAGNGVLLKPGKGASRASHWLQELLLAAELDPRLFQILPESPMAAEEAIAAGVDHVVLTGTSATGRRVLAAAAPRLTPCTLELSGCDAVFVLPGADLSMTARCLAYGLTLNAGATCIAPRRIFAHSAIIGELQARLLHELEAHSFAGRVPEAVAARAWTLAHDALSDGAQLLYGRLPGCGTDGVPEVWPVLLGDVRHDSPLLSADLFAPIAILLKFNDEEDALSASESCPLALGASVFGSALEVARMAPRINAGCVTVNDLIVPTADPRVSFGGRRASGYGVTRGPLGLLELTNSKVVVCRQGGRHPQFSPVSAEVLSGWLRMAHSSGWKSRLHGAWQIVTGMIARRPSPPSRALNGDHHEE